MFGLIDYIINMKFTLYVLLLLLWLLENVTGHAWLKIYMCWAALPDCKLLEDGSHVSS